MNRVFKTIWNRVEQRWVVASETAKSSRSGHRQSSKTSQSSGTVARFVPQALVLCVVGLMVLQSASADGITLDITGGAFVSGQGAVATGTQAIAVGVSASATGNNAIAIAIG